MKNSTQTQKHCQHTLKNREKLTFITDQFTSFVFIIMHVIYILSKLNIQQFRHKNMSLSISN